MRRTLVLLNLALVATMGYAQEIDLKGTWRFALDRNDIGISQQWFSGPLEDSINLPGSTISEGKGDPVNIETKWTAGFPDKSFFTNDFYKPYRESGNFKVPFFLQPDTYYVGSAWYQKEIYIDEDMTGTALDIFLERCHWQSTLWIDNEKIGSQNSLATPHRYTVENGLSAGKHKLTLLVDNRINDINPGENAHSISDHTQGNWNGIVGKMAITARSTVTIDSVTIVPDIAKGTLTVDMALNNLGKRIKSEISYRVFGRQKGRITNIENGWTHVSQTIPIPSDARLWDEFDPYMYNISIEAADGRWNGEFGLRELSVDDGVLKINGYPTFMRGTLNCAQFPLTGYPATDKPEWIREFSICKAYGLNHIRFHSWCPPEAAFQAADELGMYLYVECDAWAEIGMGKPIDKYFMDEAERIVYEFGNHPSFCFLSYGNEPSGKSSEILEKFVAYWKTKDNRRLYTGASGWPNMEVNDFLSDQAPRIQNWGAGNRSIINGKSPSSAYDWGWYRKNVKGNQTFISHEIGQWCVYPRFAEIDEYTGPYKAKNMEIFKETLESNGMGHLADSFLMASGKLQTLCYKADIEAALRTAGQGGYELLGLQDFSGQGTALVGALDAFWNEKGYTSAREYSQFQSPLVPLARMEKMVFVHGENFHAELELANYLSELKDTEVSWKIISSNGRCIKTGEFGKRSFSMGNCQKIGVIDFPASDLEGPEMYTLEVKVAGHENRWDFWVYPKIEISKSDDIILTDSLDDVTMEHLEKGGKVLLSIRKGRLSEELGGKIEIGFSSIFWNTSWTNGQAPHTLGILCNPSDKALAEFPTQYHSNWQWWDAMSHSKPIRIDLLGGKPIVRVIDDWFTNRPLAIILEGRIGKGRIIVSGIDFFDNIDTRPEGKQLLKSLLDYMDSPYFNPSNEILK